MTNNSRQRSFDISEILSVILRRPFSDSGREGIRNILEYMIGSPLEALSFSDAIEKCRPALLKQHEQLRFVRMPEFIGTNEEDVMQQVRLWMAQQKELYGESLLISPLSSSTS